MYTAFNGAVLDFLDDLASSFPSCKQVTSAREFYEVGMKANKRTPLALMHDRLMVPYGNRIRQHDELFFMSHDYTQDLAAAEAEAAAGAGGIIGAAGCSGGKKKGSDFIEVIKALWADMTPDDKACVFRHLDVIVSIYDAIQASPEM
jgi:hypothetical protein